MKAKTPNDNSPGRSQSHVPGDPPTQYPQDFVAGAVATAALIPQLKAGVDLYKAFQTPQNPFQLHIITSSMRNDFHQVTFRAKKFYCAWSLH